MEDWNIRILGLFILFHACWAANNCLDTRGCFPTAEELFGDENSKRKITAASFCITGEKYRSLDIKDDKDYFCSTAESKDTNMRDKTLKQVTLPITQQTVTILVPNFLTYWQSNTPVTDQEVILFLTDVFLINKIEISFIAPRGDQNKILDGRPKAMAIDKMDESNSWIGLVYIAENCARFTGVKVLPKIGPNYKATTPYCKESQFGNDTDTQDLGNSVGGNMEIPGNVQKVDFHPSLDHSSEFYTSPTVQRYFMAKALRVQLVQPFRTETLRSYFAIADISVKGSCACFGHASQCQGQNGNECDCKHNTDGIHCDKCLPLFNNRLWKMGTFDAANECEACDCNKHAVSCHYDDDKKYGVCDNCVKNTVGDHCKDCKTGYHVNQEILPVATKTCSGNDGSQVVDYECNSYCIPCNCHRDGSEASSAFLCDTQTGQCACKKNVMGTMCDECKDTFWGLTNMLTDGCQTCRCNSIGSFNSTNFCNKQTGNCVCKTNVEGQTCDHCKAGSYNLQLDNVNDGCTPCDCDPGGAVNPDCNVVTGQCTCRQNIMGRDCREPFLGRYIPKLDHLTFDVEFQKNEGLKAIEVAGHGSLTSTVTGHGLMELLPGNRMTVQFSVPAPLTRMFEVIIRFQLKGSLSYVQGQITQLNGVDYECNGQQYSGQKIWPVANVALRGPTDTGSAILTSVCMKESQTYTLTLIASSISLIDSVVLIPLIEDLTAYKSVDAETKAKMRDCREASKAVNLAEREKLGCSSVEFSLMAEIFGGAILCKCDGDGTQPSTVCEPHGGQCKCKENIILRQCGICRVDSYGNHLIGGCIACNCNASGSKNAFCNETGFCECRSNVIGMKCDSCIQTHYGLATGNGCIPCQCNADYSKNNDCADDGQCPCEPGVGGTLCTKCLDGFFSLTSQGCTPCDCHADGSSGSVCNGATGECMCKSVTTGSKCAECKPGYFGLGPWSPDGCMKCFCSGVSDKCYSPTGWYRTAIASLWTLSSIAAVDDRWAGQDDAGSAVPVYEAIAMMVIPPRYVMRIRNEGNSLNYFFLAPAKFLGNKQSAYGMKLSISLLMSSNASLIETRTDGDIILKGKDTNFVLVKQLPYLPYASRSKPVEYSFVMREDEWFVNSITGAAASYPDLMKTLSNLQSFKIRAKYSNETGSYTDLYHVMLEHASNEGNETVNNVEQCDCPEQFTGQHCESCAPGYKRKTLTDGQFGICIKCECNGHDGGPCDPQTGVCQCTHSSTGDRCEQCLPGYYGNALAGTPDDCQPCMCPGNVVAKDVNVFATTCESTPAEQTGPLCHNCPVGHTGNRCQICQAGYYGVPEDPQNNEGKCVPCVCNGRADTCNSTSGTCVNCLLHTAGKECHVCAQHYFGDAMRGTCQPCSCTESVGSTGDCNPLTGRCTCRPNVIGYSCDRCVVNAFNYISGVGCTMCDCDVNGAIGLSCDATTGQCTCRNHVTGRQCNMCEATYWNVNPLTGCDACSCNSQGSANTDPFGTCDVGSGQCTCSSKAIIGRMCDTCSKMSTKTYTFISTFIIGAYPNCVLCGECFDSWAGKIESIYNDLQQLHDKAKEIWTHYNNKDAVSVRKDLEEIKTNIANAELSIVKAQNMSGELNQLHSDLQQILTKASALDQDLNLLQQQTDRANADLSTSSQFTGVFNLDGGVILSETDLVNRVNALKVQTEASYLLGNSSWTKIKRLSFLVGSADESIRLLQNRVSTSMLVLSMAMSTYRSATIIYEGTFLAGLQNNKNAIAMGLDASAAAMIELNRIKGVLMQIQTQTNEADMLMTQAVQQAGAKKAGLDEALRQSQVAKGNADTALRSAHDAEASVNVFKTEAEKMKDELIAAFRKVVEGSVSLQEVVKQVSNITTLINSVLNLELRPLSDMETIVNDIRNTPVSNTAVIETNTKAQQALNTAQKSLDNTQKAMDDSRTALQQVQGIQDDLAQAETLRSEALRLKMETDLYNTTVNSVISQVNSKVTEANDLSQSTSTAVSLVLAAIGTANQCFVDKDAAATAAVNAATTVENEAQAIAQSHNQAGSITNLLDEELTKKDYSQPLMKIDNVNVQMNGISNELKTLEMMADLQAILHAYLVQRDELIVLENELGAQEQELSRLVQAFQLISPTSTCVTD